MSERDANSTHTVTGARMHVSVERIQAHSVRYNIRVMYLFISIILIYIYPIEKTENVSNTEWLHVDVDNIVNSERANKNLNAIYYTQPHVC